MQDLCPLCLKNGAKKKIKLLQINLQEAVWVCEEDKCIWPFGYENFVFCPRVVGKNWSCYWDDFKPTIPRLKENSEILLGSTPTVSIKHTQKEIINNSNVHCLEDINDISNNSNIIDSKPSFSDLCTPVSEGPNIISNIKSKEDCNENKILNEKITTSSINIHNSSLQSIDNDIKVKNERVNSVNKQNKEQNDISTESIKNINNIKTIPKIINIEETNIDISASKIENKTSIQEELNEKVLDINKFIDITDSKVTSEVKKLSDLKSTVSIEGVQKSNLNITMMKIDGLPPITLSFEIPVCNTTPETVRANIQQIDYKKNNTRSNDPETKITPVKRNVTSGKQYEKFSFSVIKKKMESNNSIDISNANNNSLNLKTNPKIQEVKDNSTKTISNQSSDRTHRRGVLSAIRNNWYQKWDC
ncbi:PREDICTED: probable myosin light chain kinase DDB_G0279831 [Eufriesea mexicana]|uniref:probable myosin light chain kinase DDB_G0279831 n=1 Tax=Eufriesea mexicana TaxID=516756 RepID=UPI00083BB92E|nr:PREDICTED: probable myosin light chain kinase DDB_G0279831 [Eufriesea mexicana]